MGQRWNIEASDSVPTIKNGSTKTRTVGHWRRYVWMLRIWRFPEKGVPPNHPFIYILYYIYIYMDFPWSTIQLLGYAHLWKPLFPSVVLLYVYCVRMKFELIDVDSSKMLRNILMFTLGASKPYIYICLYIYYICVYIYILCTGFKQFHFGKDMGSSK